jgi:uncharacterized protein (DUF2267 family)
MQNTKRLVQTASLAAGVIGGVAAYAPDSTAGRAARHLADRLARDVRYAASKAPGILYQLSRRRPDPNVGDDVLAARIRSSLGPLEKRLDVPRVRVMVEDRVALLHGEVGSPRDASSIEHATMQISGVEGVESHLHVGLSPGSTRPSHGAKEPRPQSAALRALLDAAADSGAGEDALGAVHAVLCAFMDRMPAGERDHVLAHLPADVRELAGPVRRHGARPHRVRTLPQLVAAVSAEGVFPQDADAITRAVVEALRVLVPEERRDVAAVLPTELRAFWEDASVRYAREDSP